MLFLHWARPAARTALPAARAPLALVTGLPIIWGEGDIDATLKGARAPADAYRWLDRRYRLTVIDRIGDKTLAGQTLMLLAQPRALAPEELVAIDAWVRAGGAALILADPSLQWPSLYPPGDPRAPPAITLLDPLLDHWGLRIDLRTLGQHAEPSAVPIDVDGQRQALTVLAPGRLVARGKDCTVEAQGLLARCAIGKGRAVVIADADLMENALWGCPEPAATCGSSNAGAIAMLLDALSGISRDGGDREN